MNITKEIVWFTILQDLMRTGADYSIAVKSANEAADAYTEKFNSTTENK